MSAEFTSPDDISRLIAHTASLGLGHLAELLRPVMAGEINLTTPTRETRMPPLHRLRKRPLCVLVGDDDYLPAGPATWACAAKLRAWAAFAIVHGAGARPEHYAMAAELTVMKRRLLLIETTSLAAQHWAGFLRERDGLMFMGVLPTDGLHPITPPKGALH